MFTFPIRLTLCQPTVCKVYSTIVPQYSTTKNSLNSGNCARTQKPYRRFRSHVVPVGGDAIFWNFKRLNWHTIFSVRTHNLSARSHSAAYPSCQTRIENIHGQYIVCCGQFPESWAPAKHYINYLFINESRFSCAFAIDSNRFDFVRMRVRDCNSVYASMQAKHVEILRLECMNRLS